MADFTGAEILAVAPLVDGCLPVALDEMLRLLETDLPGAIDAYNVRRAGRGLAALPHPAGYGLAPQLASDEYINHILIDVQTDDETQGTQAFKELVQPTILIIGTRGTKLRRSNEVFYRAGLIRMLFFKTSLEAWHDPDGRLAWAEITPRGKKPLPTQWNQYNGVAVPFQLVQPPGVDNWT